MAKAFVSGLGCVERQTKTVDIDTNGTHTILPDKGHSLDKVIVNNNVPHYDDGFVDGKKAAEDTIEPELDAILAIQYELMGVKLITCGSTEPLTDDNTFFFKEGMTWREWCDSEYNTINAYVPDYNTVQIDIDDIGWTWATLYERDWTGSEIPADEVIREDKEYFWLFF